MRTRGVIIKFIIFLSDASVYISRVLGDRRILTFNITLFMFIHTGYVGVPWRTLELYREKQSSILHSQGACLPWLLVSRVHKWSPSPEHPLSSFLFLISQGATEKLSLWITEYKPCPHFLRPYSQIPAETSSPGKPGSVTLASPHPISIHFCILGLELPLCVGAYS